MNAALIVFAAFFGIAFCIATVAASILFANGKLTLPGTDARRLQHAQVELSIAQVRLEQERVQMMTEAQLDLRLQRVALPLGLPTKEATLYGS